MNILIFGAGAIGSFFAGMLSKHNNVFLIGRKGHVEKINECGLKLEGKTKKIVKVEAFNSIKDTYIVADLVILSVKSYDTEKAVHLLKPIIRDNTYVMSLQNGLDNIEQIQKIVAEDKIIACITTHGVVFSEPGLIMHKGIGKTILGSYDKNKEFTRNLVENFNSCGINTTYSSEINKEIWIKAIINSSINPVTSLFKCKNGYLLENPILENLVERICRESTEIANANGLNLSVEDMIKKTRDVINETSENTSSMFQSVLNGKKTEIDSINGKLVELGKKFKKDTFLNEMLAYSIKKSGES